MAGLACAARGITVRKVAVRFTQGVTIEEMCEENRILIPSLFYAAVAYFLANRELVEQQLEEERIATEKLAAEMHDADPAHIGIFRI
jgi:hypothetical protein